MEKIDIEYALHCVRNSRILLEQNELLKVDGLLHSVQMSLEKHISTNAQQSLSGSDDKSSSPKSCATCAEYKWCDGFTSGCCENNYKYYKKRT